MTVFLLIVVASLLVIAFSQYLGDRFGLVAPVILLAVGIGAGLLPQLPDIQVSPDILIMAILPPLLFSAAVQMPTRDFRRNLGSISSLAIALVILTSLTVGVFFHYTLNIDYPTAVALGAVMSPTDAVATTIVKRQGVSRRVITILEGEGLMNDAAALVLLRAAIVAITGTVSVWQMALNFVWSIVGAMVIGFVVGHVSLAVRERVQEEHASTIITFTVPFLASIPTEQVGASGLVAAVVAGLVTSHHMTLRLSPATRNVSAQTWGTIGLVLESTVFLLMGVQLSALIVGFRYEEATWTFTLTLAVSCIALLLVVRAALVFLTAYFIKVYQSRSRQVLPHARLVSGRVGRALASDQSARGRGRRLSSRVASFFSNRLSRSLSDCGYYEAAPLGPREDAIIVWSGMRGAVTLAAAQTLPLWLGDRGVYLVLAFAVATISLVVQGLTLPFIIRVVKPALASPVTSVDVRSIRHKLYHAADHVPVPAELQDMLGEVHPETLWNQLVHWQHSHKPIGESADDPRELAQIQRMKAMTVCHAIELVKAQRQALVAQRDAGQVNADVFMHVLKILDSDQLRLEIHLMAVNAGVADAVEDEITRH